MSDRIIWKALLLLSALTMMAACGKNAERGAEPQKEGDAVVELYLAASPAQVATKATESATAEESKVNTIDLFIFDEKGFLNAYKHFDGYNASTPPSANCLSGDKKTIFALANSGLSEGYFKQYISTLDDLRKISFTLKDNYRPSDSGKGTLDNFEMWGSAGPMALASGKNTVEITLERVVSRVVLGRIVRNFSSPVLYSADFRIVAIYMSNVPGTYGLSEAESARYGTTDSAPWLNPYKYDTAHTPYAGYVDIDTNTDRWLRYSYPSPVPVSQGGSLNVGTRFYVFPNNAPFDAPEGGETDTFKLRQTKLVIEATCNGTTCYFPIPIVEMASYPRLPEDDPGYAAQKASFQGLRANRSFHLDEIVLTRLGTNNPDIPVHTADLIPGITIQPWDVDPSLNI